MFKVTDLVPLKVLKNNPFYDSGGRFLKDTIPAAS